MSEEPSGKVIRLLTKEERKAVESAQAMTPLTLLMVVDTIKAEARREGADEAAERLEAHCPHRADEPHQCPNLLAAHDAANIARTGTALRGDA